MDKYGIAQVFREIAFAIELTEDYPKKAIAYRRAAHIIESLDYFEKHLSEKTLEELPGIGEKLAWMIAHLAEHGTLPYHTQLMKKIPLEILDLALIPGLSPQKIRVLYEKLQIKNLDDLEKALADGRLKNLKGFSPSFINKLQERFPVFKEKHSVLFPEAWRAAHALMDIIKNDVDRVELTGALRRKCELISEINILGTSRDAKKCLSRFIPHFLIKKIIHLEGSHATVLLKNGLKADFLLVNEEEFPLALLNSTGSENHLNDLKIHALNQGYEITNHGINSIEKNKTEKLSNEQAIYQLVNIPFIPPEVREGYGEIEAAKKGKLLNLIEFSDLKGTFHCHTLDSDGHNSIEEMAQAAQEMGWEYIGISDHSKSSYQAHGMTEERLFQQIEKITKLNEGLLPNFKIFSGIECDVLKEGDLDFSNEILKQLDFVIISIHRYFNIEEELMTKRLIRAIENPYTTMVGHLTGRLLRLRKPYKLDIPKIIDACIANHKIIELNAYPDRLDMDWRFWIQAKEKGLKCSINPDAHSIADLKNCLYGIDMARKGWLEKKDVINTLSLEEIQAYLVF